MAMRMLIVAALAAGLNGATGLVAGAGLAPSAVAGGADCDEKKTNEDCGDAPNKVCTLSYATFGKPPEGVKADALQKTTSNKPCDNTSCLNRNKSVKDNDPTCNPVYVP